MRGAAPSIECPRCGFVAPPADAVGQFTTCARCAMRFDAAARERLVDPRRPRAASPEPEIVEVDDPDLPPAPRRRAPSGWLILAGVAIVATIGYLATVYYPERTAAREAELDRQRRLDDAQLERLANALASARCGALLDRIVRALECTLAPGKRVLLDETVQILEALGREEGPGAPACAAALARFERELRAHGCAPAAR